MAKLVILIAGNICAGKTTLLKYLQEHTNLFDKFLSEGEELKTVKEFIDLDSLELFYKDRKRYTSIFEFSCLMGRIVRYSLADCTKGIVIFDRGIIEGAETFVKNSYNEECLSNKDYEDYINKMQTLFDDLLRNSDQKKWLEQIIVYLRVSDSEILQERQRKRATKGETIPLEYLKDLNTCYENYFANIKAVYERYGLNSPRVIEIDASKDIEKDENYLKECAEKIIKEVGAILNGNK